MDVTSKANQIIVGCNRWDGCWTGSPYVKAVGDKRWRHLWPFYTKVVSDDAIQIIGDTQAVMDREIEYASKAGLNFWAFDYLHPKTGTEKCNDGLGFFASNAYTSITQYNYGLDLYLSSAYKRNINFCLLLLTGCLGPAEEWSETVEQILVKYMKEPTYQKVMGNRPLIFAFHSVVDHIEKFFGSREKARECWNLLRQKAVEAGLGKPYIVAQVSSAQERTDSIEKLGYDAMSNYAVEGETAAVKEHPYRVLAEATTKFWEECKTTGKPMVPIVSTGWDPRPLQGEDYENVYPQGTAPWYTEPTPQEFAEHFRYSLEWTQDNRKAVESGVVYIYAWNEIGEGGRLVPTLDEGAARLEAIQKVLNK